MPGGAIKGNGRKSDAERWRTRGKAIAALTKKYGSEEEALLKALEDPTLKKFVYEHAFGKPQENVNMESTEGFTVVLKKVDGTVYGG